MFVLAPVLLLGAAGCSSKETASSSRGSSSGTSGAPGDGGAGDAGGEDAGADAGAIIVNSCKTFDDRTATSASRTIAWKFPLDAKDRCIEIKKGQSITFNGNFGQYRVAASKGPAGGDTPNPIAGFDESSPTVKFPTAGTFGFESPDAPALQGAIRAIE